MSHWRRFVSYALNDLDDAAKVSSCPKELRMRLGLIGSWLFWILLVGSLLPRLFHEWLKGKIAGTDQGKKRNFIEGWILWYALANLLVLLSGVLSRPGGLLVLIFIWIVFILGPFVRFFDLMFILFDLAFIEKKEPQKAARSLTLLFVHYVEIVTIFASAYLLLQRISGAPLFIVVPPAIHISAWQAFFFSAATATTVGYSGVMPTSSDNIFGVALHLLTFVELLVTFWITVVEIPRVHGYLVSTK